MNVRMILDCVCAYHAIPVREVLARRRFATTCTTRRQTIALARELTGASLADIADALELSEIASVRQALVRHQTLCATNPNYARDVQRIRAQLIAAEETTP